MRKCTESFPNATELTVSIYFEGPIDRLTLDLGRILPLTRLTQLNINHRSFAFEKLIYLVQYAPNLRSLKMSYIPLYGMDLLSEKDMDLMAAVATQNTLRTLIIDGQCNVSQMKLLLHLFPCLEHITMTIYWRRFSMIFGLLFSEMKEQTRHLFSICLEDERKETMRKLADLRQKKNWINYYFSMKFIDDRLYIWW